MDSKGLKTASISALQGKHEDMCPACLYPKCDTALAVAFLQRKHFTVLHDERNTVFLHGVGLHMCTVSFEIMLGGI